MSRYRTHVGRDDFATKHIDVQGFGLTSHFREGPQKPFKSDDVFKPLPVCLPEQAHKNPHYEEICIVDTIDTTAHVDDGSLSAVLLTIGLLSIAFIRRFS